MFLTIELTFKSNNNLNANILLIKYIIRLVRKPTKGFTYFSKNEIMGNMGKISCGFRTSLFLALNRFRVDGLPVTHKSGRAVSILPICHMQIAYFEHFTFFTSNEVKSKQNLLVNPESKCLILL